MSQRPPLPPRSSIPDEGGMTHDDLVDALRAIDGLVDVGIDPPNFHFRSQPFLHFHDKDGGIYADVRFDSGDFEPVWASNPGERQELLARVLDRVESLAQARKWDRRVDRPEQGKRSSRRARGQHDR